MVAIGFVSEHLYVSSYTVVSICTQLLRSLAVTMVMFVMLTGQTRGREGWRCALEKCGELFVNMFIIGAMVFFVWCADKWDLKWTKEQV